MEGLEKGKAEKTKGQNRPQAPRTLTSTLKGKTRENREKKIKAIIGGKKSPKLKSVNL